MSSKRVRFGRRGRVALSGPSIAGVTIAHFAERDQPLAAFVPKHEPHAAKAFAEREPANVAELRIVAEHARQAIIRNLAAQMMDVVDADIGGEPAQDFRQVIIRTAVKGCLMQVPGTPVGPEGILELVLDIKQPNPDRSSQKRNRKVHETKRAP